MHVLIISKEMLLKTDDLFYERTRRSVTPQGPKFNSRFFIDEDGLLLRIAEDRTQVVLPAIIEKPLLEHAHHDVSSAPSGESPWVRADVYESLQMGVLALHVWRLCSNSA